ncbi:hypothetical protein SAMN05444161_8265 [Rhizobiales bacterium GAS191]|jgi:hypothetical protein|nr:hypothetical protein SAMN05519103_06365 [Rhizobiales bacterium GAS113]SEF09402.1 hypothetical protein SAMN05444161_8265 [Rhizobiales bacterium GAS191]
MTKERRSVQIRTFLDSALHYERTDFNRTAYTDKAGAMHVSWLTGKRPVTIEARDLAVCEFRISTLAST